MTWKKLLWSDDAVVVRKNSGGNIGTRPRLNFIEGSNITLAISDDAGGDEIDISIAATQYSHPSAPPCQAATSALNGHATSTQITKLDGIETSADVTDAINVSVAGALMKTGGTMTGTLNMGNQLIDDVGDVQSYDVFGINIKNHTGSTIINMGLSGYSFTAFADINMNTKYIKDLHDPTLAQDAATKNYIDDLTKLTLKDPTELTISGGVVTATQSWHTIDTEGNAGTDNLDTINGCTPGQILTITPISAIKTVIVKHDTGNILLNSGDFTMDDDRDTLMLMGDRWGDYWIELSRFAA